MDKIKMIPDELLAKISGAGEELNDQDKETLRALALMFKSNEMTLQETIDFFKKQYPASYKPFTDYIETVWETL